ncbi:DUF2078 family protein [Natrialba magadii ATCC 43099]|uniref:DUF2078 family protein n=1 Tax=Natrialba magadii (strain ATCC 43099 / DSM 3394 / CCM 3739 / CIP 104546 / IAM 13178 / JCM 8861 / NBRC 102185 / NCIMB 2190 / MS3) TaxID=547559 RepID=D3SYG8_NATMM|nr:hypothetical protein [Natrialba magadii]ADD06139.1 DUF2078 family protein [Natrialba magadii ATCC 43099]ELY30862.1 hypothetical protein C500_07488 [Natrialba magadii ATCC 43099]
MELPAWFRDLPPGTTVLIALFAVFVGLTALSMVLGIVFAGIALGLEFGSLTLGILTALFGLAIVVVPFIAALKVLSNGGNDVDSTDEESDPVEALRAQYVAGELDEETFEQRLTALLDDHGRDGEPDKTSAIATDEERSLLEDHD